MYVQSGDGVSGLRSVTRAVRSPLSSYYASTAYRMANGAQPHRAVMTQLLYCVKPHPPLGTPYTLSKL